MAYRSIPLQQISLWQMLLLILLAKLISICAFALVFPALSEDLKSAASHLSSMAFLLLLICIAAKSSPGAVIRKCRPATIQGSLLPWFLLAIPLGIVVRFGSDGIGISLIGIFSSKNAHKEYIDFVSNPGAHVGAISALATASMLFGAIEEEFTYRRTLQWAAFKKWGAAASVIVTSVFFGVVHLNPIIVSVGCALSLIYIASGNFWVIVLVHLSGNLALAVTAPYVKDVGWENYRVISLVFGVGYLALLFALSASIFRRRGRLE